MDTNFRIIWFEDIDEWFNTLSRRVKRYIKRKDFNVEIKRIKNTDEFSMVDSKLQNYDLLVVDYELEKNHENDLESIKNGSDIITQIRQGKFVNDILFYSSHGYNVLSEEMRKSNLQGVFIADRDNEEFFELAQRLIDKSIRRAENIINIRGIVMDCTSDFDSKIRDLISIIWNHLGEKEEGISIKIKKRILLDNKKLAEKLYEKYEDINKNNINNLLEEREFNAYRQARLLEWCIDANDLIRDETYKILKDNIKGYDENQGFFKNYMKDVINYRNALAHVKSAPAQEGEFYIGEINGEKISFDEKLCQKIRKTIIQYSNVLEKMYTYIEDNY